MTPPLTMFGMSGPVSTSTAAVASADEGVLYKDISEYTHTRFDYLNVNGGNSGLNVLGVYISPDGTKFYTVDSNDRLRQETLSTPYDISSHGATSDYTIVTGASNGNDSPTGIQFKDDGLKFWITDADDYLYEWTMTTAWDISTASYTRAKSMTSPYNQFRGPFFKSDGSMFFGVDSYYDYVYSHSMSTDWDITSMANGYTARSALMDISPISEGAVRGLWFNDDGTKVYVVGQSRAEVMQWNLTTAYDVSEITGSPDDALSTSSVETGPHGICFSSDGKYMYIGGVTDDGVDQYTRT